MSDYETEYNKKILENILGQKQNNETEYNKKVFQNILDQRQNSKKDIKIMPDKIINISSIKDLIHHYGKKHSCPTSIENAYIENNTVFIMVDGEIIPIKICVLCGKKIVVNDREIRIAKQLEHFKLSVSLDDVYAGVELTKLICYLAERKRSKTEPFIETVEIDQIVQRGLLELIRRDKNMSDKIITISSIEDLPYHYSEKHSIDTSIENAYIENNTVVIVVDGEITPIKFCVLCGKKIVVDDREIRIAKQLEHFKLLVRLDEKFADIQLMNQIFYIANRKRSKIEPFMETVEIEQMVRWGFLELISRDKNNV